MSLDVNKGEIFGMLGPSGAGKTTVVKMIAGIDMAKKGTIHVLRMMMEGSFWYVLLITFLLAMTALTLGTLLSAFANNELQMIQFIPLVVVPQVFFSGLFNLDTMEPWLRSIGVAMPLYYGADALREIMIRGKGWEAISFDVSVLVGFSLLFMILNVLALKKYRKL
ncbi:ABC transporter permease [Neobacillus thermocopriae]|nr:ABC transporter permease [Neobacillus thermocopriae]